MDFLSLKILLMLLTTAAFSKTLRFQIVTRDDGRKEIINPSTGATPSPDVRFLARDLNLLLDNSSAPEDKFVSRDLNNSSGPEETKKLMNTWNTYTANGWSGRKNSLYANSTPLLVLDKKARSEDFSNEIIEPPSFWEMIQRLYDCFQSDEKHESSIVCLKSRMTKMFLNLMDQSFNQGGKSSEEKTLIQGKKLLKGALLPLLVILVIKYLVALPVIAAGLITIKTFWLSLLSAGVAAFGAPWKSQHVVKRYRPDADQGWSGGPAWAANLHIDEKMEPTEKYFM